MRLSEEEENDPLKAQKLIKMHTLQGLKYFIITCLEIIMDKTVLLTIVHLACFISLAQLFFSTS